MLKKKYNMYSLIAFVLFIAFLIINAGGVAEAQMVKFDGFQEGESTEGPPPSTTLHIKIKDGKPGDELLVIWEKPQGTEIARREVILDENGNAEFDWEIPVYAGDGPDYLTLTKETDRPDTARDIDRGKWVEGGSATRMPHISRIPTLTHWGLIMLIGLLIISGLWLWRRRVKLAA